MAAGRRLVGATGLVVASLVCLAGVVRVCAGAFGELMSSARSGDGWAGDGWAGVPLDTALTALAAAVLAVCSAWLTLVTAAAVIESLTGVSSAPLRAVSPAVVRRTVAVCCGIAVGTSGTLAATAHPAPPDPPGTLLSGLPLPDRATGAVPVTAAAHTRAASLPGPTTASPYVVRRGDSLWSIASGLLGSTAPRRVDAAWRSLYRANRAAVGEDPDLLTPGTALRVPGALTTPGPSRADGARPSRIHRKDAS